VKIECVCVDAKNRPSEIPVSKWIVEQEKYNITHVYNQLQQQGIKGVELAEFDISECVPFNCYRLDRFAFTPENLQKLISMIKDCTDLNDINIDGIVEKLTTVEEYYES
jgi:hypothetical protein